MASRVEAPSEDFAQSERAESQTHCLGYPILCSRSYDVRNSKIYRHHGLQLRRRLPSREIRYPFRGNELPRLYPWTKDCLEQFTLFNGEAIRENAAE